MDGQQLLQRKYYSDTAHRYEEMHVSENDEHTFALNWMVAAAEHFGVRSILDIGSGTGRALSFIAKHRPQLAVMGVEPVAELRQVAYQRGIPETQLVDGDATSLNFADGQFDLVCEFGVLHHIRRPELAVAEMLRVSKKAIFISDSNNFGQGGRVGRACKQIINAARLWPLANLIKTRGRGYTISEGDGLAYSYSVFQNYKQIRKQCPQVHLLNTAGGSINPYRTATHVALLGIKA